jgi:PAS domain S-box-containing protein
MQGAWMSSVVPTTIVPPSQSELVDLSLSSDGTAAGTFLGALQSRDLLQALPVAVYKTDAAGRIVFYNEAAARLWGCRPELGKSEWCGSWRLRWPDGRLLPHDQCPMAIALKEGRPIKGAEAVAERPDGTLVPFLAYPTPLWDESGRMVGAVNTLVDISEHKAGREAEQRLAAIVESSDDAIASKSLDGIISSWNAGAERLFGYSAEEAIGQPITMLIPPDRQHEEPEIIARIRRGERVDHYETVRQRKDGTLIDISVTVSPIRHRDGHIIGASKIARDIGERRRLLERQTLLLREMNHRVKNLFAVASSVVALSANSAHSPKELAQAVRERLTALARAHALTLPDLTPDGTATDRATALPELVRTIILPYLNRDPAAAERIVIAGPDVMVGRTAATNLALLIHEFATNAAKYGALSTSGGRVDVTWRIEDGRVALTWREHGGPPVPGEPATEGFGSLLARTAVTSGLGGQVTREWRAEGLAVQLSAPLDRLKT